MQAVKDLKVSIVRYPGGNFVSNYIWPVHFLNREGAGKISILRNYIGSNRLLFMAVHNTKR